MAGTAVVIPARDEGDSIAATVEAVRAIAGVTLVLVVDDGSRDATAERAQAAGARTLIRHEPGGKAAALEAGLREIGVTRSSGVSAVGDWDAVLLLDADLGSSAHEAAELLGPVLAGSADMVIAAFPPSPKGSGGFGLVKGLARAGIRSLGGRRFEPTAPLSGQRALGPRALRTALPLGRGYGVEVTLTIRALRGGLRVVEVPTTMTHRHTVRDAAGFMHRGRQFVDVATALAGLAFEGKPRA
jgi:glycosyltransferase involved in cell wall biosynthesis